jgi:hypothetical protein
VDGGAGVGEHGGVLADADVDDGDVAVDVDAVDLADVDAGDADGVALDEAGGVVGADEVVGAAAVAETELHGEPAERAEGEEDEGSERDVARIHYSTSMGPLVLRSKNCLTCVFGELST